MIHRSVPFKVDRVICGIRGRYPILGEILISELTSMKNVHGQKEDNPTFFELFLFVASLPRKVLMAGDF